MLQGSVGVLLDKKFDIKLALLRYHHDIPAQHAGGLLETQAAGWAVGRPQVDGTVSVFGYDSQSYSEADLFTAGFVQSRVRQAALAGPAGGAFNFDPVTAAGITPALKQPWGAISNLRI